MERPADMGGWSVTITIANTAGERIGAKQFGHPIEARLAPDLGTLIEEMRYKAMKRFDEALMDALYRSGLSSEDAAGAVRAACERMRRGFPS
jgi:hypothetical protein